MEDKEPSIKPIAYTYGLYSALISIGILVIMYVTNMDKSWTVSIVSIVLSIAIYFYGIKAFKEANGNLLSIGQAIKVGLAIAVIGGLISAVYSYFHYEFIYPEFIDMQRETAYKQMVEANPNMTAEQIEQSLGITNIFMNSTFFSLSSVIGSLIFGLIISVILGLFMRKDR
ncbi:uncharacterized protein DUF4199 [Winogradskyella epiphytica]|uniref:Uncharacterized protein DUF4199 n=1 Tax=Winogradskyella epiphytica TaxID=262005 RepID=A0A2V4WWK9_9FLAO|nr:DUF4199 domain-containing protein [Winogradskyella epiphytica]PYE81092.1 uncharacterized protein DUF4199 [Winogradskyella epiphytica]